MVFRRGCVDVDVKPGANGIQQHRKKKMRAGGKENRSMKNIEINVS